MTTTKAELPQEVRIGFLVHDVSRMRRTFYDQAFKPLGITRSQWWVLTSLSRHVATGMLQSELARDIDVGKVAVGGLLDRLEAAQYVAREPDAADRRGKRVRITDQGRTVLKQIVEVASRLNGQIQAGIEATDIETTERTLEAMKENLRRHLGETDEVELPVGIYEADAEDT